MKKKVDDNTPNGNAIQKPAAGGEKDGKPQRRWTFRPLTELIRKLGREKQQKVEGNLEATEELKIGTAMLPLAAPQETEASKESEDDFDTLLQEAEEYDEGEQLGKDVETLLQQTTKGPEISDVGRLDIGRTSEEKLILPSPQEIDDEMLMLEVPQELEASKEREDDFDTLLQEAEEYERSEKPGRHVESLLQKTAKRPEISDAGRLDTGRTSGGTDAEMLMLEVPPETEASERLDPHTFQRLRKKIESVPPEIKRSERWEEIIEKISEEAITECEDFERNKETLIEGFEGRMNRILSQLPKKDYSKHLMRLLFSLWAKDEQYDRHMQITKHELALALLLRQGKELDNVNLGYNRPIFGPQILEMAGGTGTVIKCLCDGIDPKDVARLQITLNDISPAMKRIAKEKLKDLKCGVEYTEDDIRSMASFEPESQDTVIMSQVLHLIAHPEELETERNSDYPIPNYHEHTRTKISVIKKAFDLLAPNGYFILIDEFPATLSDNPGNPFEKTVSYLFNSTFRPVENPLALRASIMGNISCARFVTELKIPIDYDHSMYMYIYRKDIAKLKNREKQAKRGEITETVRTLAQRRVVDGLKAIDKHFIDRYQINNIRKADDSRGSIVQLLPMGDESVVFDSRTERKELGEEDKETYDGAIVAIGPTSQFKDFFKKADEERIATMRNVIKAVKTGGWLVITGEWPLTGTANMSKHYFRDTFMKNFNVMFEGALRVRMKSEFANNVHGYLFRKRGPTSLSPELQMQVD